LNRKQCYVMLSLTCWRSLHFLNFLPYERLWSKSPFVERSVSWIGKSAHVWCSRCHTIHTIRYDSVYLMCSKKLTGSQLSLPHGHQLWQLHYCTGTCIEYWQCLLYDEKPNSKSIMHHLRGNAIPLNTGRPCAESRLCRWGMPRSVLLNKISTLYRYSNVGLSSSKSQKFWIFGKNLPLSIASARVLEQGGAMGSFRRGTWRVCGVWRQSPQRGPGAEPLVRG